MDACFGPTPQPLSAYPSVTPQLCPHSTAADADDDADELDIEKDIYTNLMSEILDDDDDKITGQDLLDILNLEHFDYNNYYCISILIKLLLIPEIVLTKTFNDVHSKQNVSNLSNYYDEIGLNKIIHSVNHKDNNVSKDESYIINNDMSLDFFNSYMKEYKYDDLLT